MTFERAMATYTFVSADPLEIEALTKHFASTSLPLRFSATIPIIKIPGIDAVYNTVTGYESWGGALDYNLQETVVRECTPAMRSRGLPHYTVVGRVLTDGEDDPFSIGVSTSILTSVVNAVRDFNSERELIHNIALLLDQFRFKERHHGTKDVIQMLNSAFGGSG